jgi:hypothetical protein
VLDLVAKSAGLRSVGDAYEVPEGGKRILAAGLMSLCEAIRQRVEAESAAM